MAETKTYNLPITGMTCANCVSTVERSLKKVPGVMSAQVNLSSERAAVDFDPKQASLNAMLQRVRKAGYDLAAVGVLLSPAVGALLMSASTVIVALNAQLLRKVKLGV